MRTELGAQLTKDFSKGALIEIQEGARARETMLRNEAQRRREDGGWSSTDIDDMLKDAREFDLLARTLSSFIFEMEV